MTLPNYEIDFAAFRARVSERVEDQRVVDFIYVQACDLVRGVVDKFDRATRDIYREHPTASANASSADAAPVGSFGG